MNKIQDLIPTVIIDTIKKYAKTKEKECRNNNEQFKKKVVSSVKGYCRDIIMGLTIAILIVAGFLFWRRNE